MISILIVDDEQSFLNSVTRKLRMEGHTDLTTATSPLEALRLAVQRSFDIALLDITMPEMDGLELMKHIKAESPFTECIMVTADDRIPKVIEAVKLGAYDYLVKPIRPEQLIHSLEKAWEHRRLYDFLLLNHEEDVRESLMNPDGFAEVITIDPKMIRLFREAELHAGSNIPVLITGETGTGKELMARAVHRAGGRPDGPFVAVNMLSLSPSLFESEFCGHTRGAFTGAVKDKKGYLHQAEGGTLLLDEIGDLSMEIQGKLLRILQEGEFTPLGRTGPQKANVRFIATTNQDLERMVDEGRFRKDLFYRLRYACLKLPPLRERKEDLRILSAGFIRESSRPEAALTEKAERALMTHDWPGNVRELKGAIEAAANLAHSGTIHPEHLNLPEPTTDAPGRRIQKEEMLPLAEVERKHIIQTYQALECNKTQTARVLGIGVATLQRKLKAYGIP